MSMEFSFSAEHQCIIATVKEKFDVAEYRDVMKRITSSTEFPPNTPAIWDFTEMDFSHFDTTLVENIAAIRSTFSSRGKARIALIVPDKLGYGMMRMIQVFTEINDHSVVVFDLAEAIRWLKP